MTNRIKPNDFKPNGIKPSDHLPFCGEVVGVVTDSLEEGVSRGKFGTSLDWQQLLVFRTPEILATFAETNKGAMI